MICPGSVLFCAAGYLFLCIFNNNFLQPQPGRMEEIMPVKYVFVTGGVVSGLGKGITAASLGRLLKARGFSVTMQKFDPYINIDPGTMNPIQHGEVFVTVMEPRLTLTSDIMKDSLTKVLIKILT